MPNFDTVTHYLHEWSKKIVEDAKMRGFDVYPLDGPNATKQNFESRLNKNNPKFVFLNGHGDPNMVCGHKGSDGTPQPILINNVNDGLMKNRIVYARACKSLETLGRNCVEKGATAYIGYAERFMVLFDPVRYSRPLGDKIAESFMEISNIIPSVLVKGGTVKEAVERSFQQFLKNVEYQEAHYTSETPLILSCLIHDMAALGAIGNPDAKVT